MSQITALGFASILVANNLVALANDPPPLSDLTASRRRLGFVPGDAFFPIRIEAQDHFLSQNPYPGELSESVPETSLLLNYRYPPTVGVQTDCAGFGHAKVTNISEKDFKTLYDFYFWVDLEREYLDKDEGRDPWRLHKVESDPFHEARPALSILIVNKDFDFNTKKPFVRYNEDWQQEQPTYWPGGFDNFEKSSASTRSKAWPRIYQPHVVSAEAVLEDWVNGAKVAPLKIAVPQTVTIDSTPRGHEIHEPVEIDFREVTFVGYPSGDTQKVFGRQLNRVFYVANTEGLFRYRWEFANEPNSIHLKLVKESVKDPNE